MKIAVIGKGTSSIIQILHLLELNCEIDVYFDPDTPILNVGESSTPSFADLIFMRTGISIGMLHDNDIASYKIGVKFINWSKGNTFRHYFNPASTAMQFETTVLNSFFEETFKSLGINYIGERVDDYKLNGTGISINGRNYNFAIFCTGWPDDKLNHPIPFESVNSAVLYRREWLDEKEPLFTLHTATPHGWEFGLPFPRRGITKFGYLFNNKIDNPEEILKDISSNPDNKEVRAISWVPKYSKKMIINPYVAFGGNRLFFSEPLQALSLLYYNVFGSMIVDYLKNRTEVLRTKINVEYNSFIAQYLASVAFHYQFGSTHDTPFWQNIVEKSRQYLTLHPNYSLNILKEGFKAQYLERKERFNFVPDGEDNTDLRPVKIGSFEWVDFRDLYNGFVGEWTK